MESQAAVEMPRYSCHKTVHALKIQQLHYRGDGAIVLNFEGSYGEKVLTFEELCKKPDPEPGWYYVVYSGGYFSFSPAKDFEEGYTLEA